MSRNLCTSSCCGNIVRLSDLRDKPIEFRRHHIYAPQIGTRWDCPTCGTAYFAIWRREDKFWSDVDQAQQEELLVGQQTVPNPNHGEFIAESNGRLEQTGCFVIDLSYYETYNDEPMWDEEVKADILSGKKKPWFLCEGDCKEAQWVWGTSDDNV